MRDTRPAPRTWHSSRGIVFANSSPVVSPHIPIQRMHSAPADPLRKAMQRPEEQEDQSIRRSESAGPAGLVGDADQDNDVEMQDAKDLNDGVVGNAVDPDPAESDTDDAEMMSPFTPLDYKIPDNIFREAKLAEPGSLGSYWSYSMYRGPPTETEPGPKIKVHYCKSQLTTERVLKQYFMDEKILGFDLEWHPNASSKDGVRRNVSLVQLSSTTRIGLFHLSLYPAKDNMASPLLKKILEDPEVTKLGVAISGDCTRLRKFLGIDPHGLMELSHLYKLVKFCSTGEHKLINKRLVSLAQQVQEYLGLPMYKDSSVRSSDWSKTLRMDQIIYSASDAYAAVQLFAILDHQRQQLDPEPPMPAFAELRLPIRLPDIAIIIPTADEALEPEDETEDTDVTPAIILSDGSDDYIDSDISDDFLLSAVDSIEIEGDSAETPQSKPISTARAPPAPRGKDRRIVEADAWVGELCDANPDMLATRASMRAYYIWCKNEDLRPESIAALLRDPPLKTNTVRDYILKAIQTAQITTFPKARLRNEVLQLLSEDVVARRYSALLEMCNEPDKDTTRVSP